MSKVNIRREGLLLFFLGLPPYLGDTAGDYLYLQLKDRLVLLS